MPEITTVAIALLHQPGQFGSHLRDALGDLGAAVVYEAVPSGVDRDALEGSGARVVIVNLDADSDTYIDALYDVLDAGDYEVVFNDAQVSSNLQGWDQARWARNLAAKILRKPEIAEPPRPPGAEPVPTPVQKSAHGVPVAEKPGPAAHEVAPAPAEPSPAAAAQELPSTERPTVKMPLPPELQAEAPAPVQAGGGVDIAELAEFASLLDEPAGPAAAAESGVQPAPIPDLGELAAELDALFATAPASTPATPGDADEFDIALPAEFDLSTQASDDATPDTAAATLDALDIPFENAPAAVPDDTAKGDAVDHLHDEFPAIFDQLDVAAASVPEAVNAEFKPAERPPAEPQKATPEVVVPPAWSLQGDEVAAAPTGRAEFGIEKISAEEFLAPVVEESAKPVAPAIAEPSFTLELMPIEEAIAPSLHNPDYFHEQRLDDAGTVQPIKVGTGAGVSRVVVLGASIGGPEAVRDFLGALPAGFPALFVLAQHMGEEFLELMSAQLRKAIALTVRNPAHGERVSHGDVLVVPTTRRLQVDGEGVVTLELLREKGPYAPSIDQVLRDVTDAFGAKAGAIIFSGMAHDAIEGSQYLKSKGGWVWAQDPDTCVVSSMIDGARAAGAVDFLAAPAKLAEKLIAEYGKA